MNSIIAYFNKPILKISLLFGLATGVTAFLFFVALYLVNGKPLGTGRGLDLGIYIIFIAGSCWHYRKNIGNGLLHLWEALTMGYVITSVGAILNGWLIYFFVKYIDSNVFADYIGSALKVLEEGKSTKTNYLSEAEYRNLYDTIKNNDPSILISNEITQRLLLMIIPILIISLIFRKQDYGVFHNKS